MKRRSEWKTRLAVLAIFLLVLAVAAGCRSRSTEAPVQEAPATEAPTQESAASPTEAPTEQPTQEAVSVQPAQESEQPVDATVGAQEAAPAPADDTSVATGSTVEGVCSNPYYPVRDGAVYHYQMTMSGSDQQEMTMTFAVTGPESFTTSQTIGGVTTEMAWQCTPGGLLATDFGLSGLDIPGIEYTIDAKSGVTFPLPDQMVEGTTWQNQFSMSGQMTSDGFSMAINMKAVTDNVLSGFEDVTTPAGTFNAARVDTSTTFELSTDMAGAPAMPAMTSESTVWLSEGVGMVKTESTDPTGGTISMELVAME